MVEKPFIRSARKSATLPANKLFRNGVLKILYKVIESCRPLQKTDGQIFYMTTDIDHSSTEQMSMRKSASDRETICNVKMHSAFFWPAFEDVILQSS